MKLLLFIAALFFLKVAICQNDSIQRVYSERIANRMKDSLLLSEIQYNAIYQFSLWIAQQKALIWIQYAGLDSLRFYLQRMENKRDSLYMLSLKEDGKYDLYLEKKNRLISGN